MFDTPTAQWTLKYRIEEDALGLAYLANPTARVPFGAWLDAYRSDPDTAWDMCPRGDWLLRVAEARGADVRELVRVAAEILDTYWERYAYPIGLYADTAAKQAERFFDDGDEPDWPMHEAGHEAEAAGGLLIAQGRLAHVSAHQHSCAPCLAVAACISAAELADWKRGRLQGRIHAERETADLVRSLLNKPA